MDAQTARRALRTNIRARPGDRRTGRESSAIPAAAGDAEQTGFVNRPSSPQRGPAEGRAVTAVGIVVNGRNVAVPEHFRVHVAKKMAPVVERYGHNVPTTTSSCSM